MVYRGHIENGTVILDGSPKLPDGAEVELHLVSERSEKQKQPEQTNKNEPPWFKYFGAIKDLPPDASQRIDEVLYGHSRRS